MNDLTFVIICQESLFCHEIGKAQTLEDVRASFNTGRTTAFFAISNGLASEF
jgi:hypothetical protein